MSTDPNLNADQLLDGSDTPAMEPVVEPPKMPTRTFGNPIADRFFKRRSRKVVPVSITVPDDDGVEETFEFLVHEMTAGMRSRFEAIMAENARQTMEEDELLDMQDKEAIGEKIARGFDIGNFKIAVVAASVTDPDGNPLIEQEELDMVADAPSTLIEPLFEKAMELSNLGRIKKREIDAENA